MLLFTLSVSLAQPSATADIVFLKNGDRLSGTVSMSAAGKLVVATEYAGKVEVKLEHVAGVETEKPVSVELGDGSIRQGAFRVSGAGQTLAGEDGAKPLDWDAVQRIAPDAETLEEEIAKANKTWGGAVGSGVVFRSGEQDTFDATLDVEFARKRPSDVLSLKLNAAYGEAADQLNTQRLYGEGKWQFYPGERFYYFIVASGEHDLPRRLEVRAKGGGGVGYDFIKSKRTTLSADAGLEYVYERWRNFGPGKYRDAVNDARRGAFDNLINLSEGIADGSLAVTPRNLVAVARSAATLWEPDVGPEIRTENYLSGRLGMRFEQTLFKESKLSNELNVLPNLEEFGEFLATNKLAFTSPFSESLSLRIQLRTEYVSDPVDSVDEFDNTLTLGVRYEY
jgi:hypothetical protein